MKLKRIRTYYNVTGSKKILTVKRFKKIHFTDTGLSTGFSFETTSSYAIIGIGFNLR